MTHSLVIFGASGDLTKRKLIPALYRLFHKDQLPEATRVIGCSRSAFTDEQWRGQLADSAQQFLGDGFDPETWQAFAALLHYQPLDIGNAGDFQKLSERLDLIEQGADAARVYYLSTLPRLYAQAAEQLGKCGLNRGAARRIVVEKPFGVDRPSARALNDDLHRVFDERQIYRIDHYLGKETVQNLLVLRFANSIFEPIWNRNYVDHVQITVAEEVQVGSRGGYYDQSGVLRDMFQNHLLQLMMITAMEAPPHFDAEYVRNEKVKVLQAIRPLSGAAFAEETLRGQYRGYRDEPDVAGDSQTATFAALKLHIDNWRWNGVPFYLRSGKAMSCRTTQIVIQFHKPPHLLFSETGRRDVDANRLVVQIQPAEGVQLQFQTKVPDAGMRLRMTDLDFRFRREFSGDFPDAYQRLLLDALTGDASLFARSDEVELAWGVIDPILAAWSSPAAPPLGFYDLGQWGPSSSDEWMDADQRRWFDVCPVLH